MLLEHFVLGIHLVELVCKSATNYFSQYLLKRLLIRILVYLLRPVVVSLVVGLLAHLSNLLVHCLNSN